MTDRTISTRSFWSCVASPDGIAIARKRQKWAPYTMLLVKRLGCVSIEFDAGSLISQLCVLDTVLTSHSWVTVVKNFLTLVTLKRCRMKCWMYLLVMFFVDVMASMAHSNWLTCTIVWLRSVRCSLANVVEWGLRTGIRATLQIQGWIQLL